MGIVAQMGKQEIDFSQAMYELTYDMHVRLMAIVTFSKVQRLTVNLYWVLHACPFVSRLA